MNKTGKQYYKKGNRKFKPFTEKDKNKDRGKKQQPKDFIPPDKGLFIICFFGEKIAECMHYCRKKH